MIGQRHHLIARTTMDGRLQYWRGRRGDRSTEAWTFDMSASRSYRRPGDALSAARQIGTNDSLEVLEVEMVVSRVCYRVSVEAVDEKK